MVAFVLVAENPLTLALAAVSPGQDAGLPGHRPRRPLDAGLLGRLCGGGIDAAVRAAQGRSLGLRQTRRRRDAGAGARSRARSRRRLVTSGRLRRDDRPWGGTDPPAVVYTYAPGRGGEHLEKLLANYRGIVQCDGYAPYKKLPADRITVAFCWSHLRREFSKIAKRGDAPRSPPKPSRALPRSTPSRRMCAAQVPISAVPRAR